MAIAGIEGLAQGFMQGMALKRQNDRQDVLDAQNLERFSMDKERFATQQAASAFELQNAQTNAANAATDRIRTLGIQKKNDDYEANLGRILGAGTPEGELVELEKIRQGSGVKGAFARDPKTGGLAKNADGTFQWVNEGGSTENVTLEDSIGRYIAEVDPKGEFIRKRTQQDELAKETRANDAELGKLKVQHDYRVSEQSAADKNANYRAALTKPPKEPDVLPANLLPYFTEEVEVGKDRNGTPMMKKAINQAAVDSFLQWSTENKTTASPKAYQLWRSSKPVIQGATRPQVGGKGDVVGDWIKSRNIGTQDELNSAIAELRAKNPNWSKEQLKQAFVNAGVME